MNGQTAKPERDSTGARLADAVSVTIACTQGNKAHRIAARIASKMSKKSTLKETSK